MAVKGVAHGLRTIVKLTEVHQPIPQPSIPSAHLRQEDSINTSSLEVLATCDNVEIRKAATKILCERFFADAPSRARLLKDLNSRNPAVQHRARLASKLLFDYGVVPDAAMYPALRRERLERIERSGTGLWVGGRSRLGELGGYTQNDEERDLRRRRREAVVINEGDRPISQDDVYMRDVHGRLSLEQ